MLIVIVIRSSNLDLMSPYNEAFDILRLHKSKIYGEESRPQRNLVIANIFCQSLRFIEIPLYVVFIL